MPRGCRPVGPVMRITRCAHNMLLELDDRPAVEALRHVVPHDERGGPDAGEPLALPGHRHGHAAGRAGPGRLPGAEPHGHGPSHRRTRHRRDAAGGPAGALPSAGRRHVRRGAGLAPGPLCGGPARRAGLGLAPLLLPGPRRGAVRRTQPRLGPLSQVRGPRAAGRFFCNGEIGPVGGTTFLHGYTSSFGIFRPRQR